MLACVVMNASSARAVDWRRCGDQLARGAAAVTKALGRVSREPMPIRTFTEHVRANDFATLGTPRLVNYASEGTPARVLGPIDITPIDRFDVATREVIHELLRESKSMDRSGLAMIPVEVGAWIFNFPNGDPVRTHLFSDRSAKAHVELAVLGPFIRQYAELRVRSARRVLSAAIFQAMKNMAERFPSVREFHIYAVSDVTGVIQVGHYGFIPNRRDR